MSVRAEKRYYYALVLDKIRLFGGNWAYVFHRTSETLMSPDDVLSEPQRGFNAFVDFIFAKREKRITRLMRKVNCARFEGPGYLKKAGVFDTEPRTWFISDMNLASVKRTQELSDAEKRYPLTERIDDTIMMKRVDSRWTPETDERI